MHLTPNNLFFLQTFLDTQLRARKLPISAEVIDPRAPGVDQSLIEVNFGSTMRRREVISAELFSALDISPEAFSSAVLRSVLVDFRNEAKRFVTLLDQALMD